MRATWQNKRIPYFSVGIHLSLVETTHVLLCSLDDCYGGMNGFQVITSYRCYKSVLNSSSEIIYVVPFQKT